MVGGYRETRVMSTEDEGRVTGHLSVEGRAQAGRVWVAAYSRRDGSRTRKTLGPARVKDSGRTTARGAKI
jgi:hypothetical protein